MEIIEKSAVLASNQQPSLLADFIDRDGLARELGRTIRTVDRLLLRGDGPPRIKIGAQTFFRRAAVLEWLRSKEEPARPQSKRRGGTR